MLKIEGGKMRLEKLLAKHGGEWLVIASQGKGSGWLLFSRGFKLAADDDYADSTQ